MLRELKTLRLQAGLTQQEVASRVGITRQAYSNYEQGIREPEYATLCSLAEVLHCSVGRLLGYSSRYESEGGVRIPILGTVKGGYNRVAQQELEGYEVADVAAPEEYFFLRVTGDSMSPQIQDGDLALIHSQETIESGEVGVVLLENEEATVKRVVFSGRNIILQPFNNNYTPIIVEQENCRVLGRVVRTIREW